MTPGFFRAVEARLLEGRAFTDSDDPSSAPVAIVDDRLARLAWPGGNAVGKRLAVDPQSTGRSGTWVTVVGVVRHLRHRTLTQEVREQVYFPQRQVLRDPMAYVVRTTGDPSAWIAPVRQAIARLDPLQPLYEARPLDDYVFEASASQRFTMILVAAFAAVALVMACVGLYGVIAYSVARRRREFGIRLALGARPGQVQRLVLREGLQVAAWGLALGLPAAYLCSRLLQAQLFGVTPRDPASYAVALAVLAGAAALASWLGARRASTASPQELLRTE